MAKRIDQMTAVTPADGDKIVIYDSSTGDAGTIDVTSVPFTTSNSASKKVSLNNNNLSVARTIVVPDVDGEMAVQKTPSYWLKAYTEDRKFGEYVNYKTLVAFSPDIASFTLTPAQVPVKLATQDGNGSWKALANNVYHEFYSIVGLMTSADFNDSVGDGWTSQYADLIRSATYCSNPLTNVSNSFDTDNTVTQLPFGSWADNTNMTSVIRAIVGTNGTDIYYFNMYIATPQTSGYAPMLYMETSSNTYAQGGSVVTPKFRKTTSFTATGTAAEILNNTSNLLVGEGLAVMAATIRMPI